LIASFAWMGDAACRGLHLVLFYGQEGERGSWSERRELHAKAVCWNCPVRAACLEWAIERGEQGVWGGTNEEERAKERRRRQRRAAEARAAAAAATPTQQLTPPNDDDEDLEAS
jgi:Transcription factor WhiB.